MDNDDTTLSLNGAAKNRQRVSVLLPLGIDKPYDYLVPCGMEVVEGAYVKVPFGHRLVTGVIWEKKKVNTIGELDYTLLKLIVHRYEAPPMSEPLRKLVDWVAQYTVSKKGAVLRMAISVPAALEPIKVASTYVLGDLADNRHTSARQRVIEVLKDNKPRTAKYLSEHANVSKSVINRLVVLGGIKRDYASENERLGAQKWNYQSGKLSREQNLVANVLKHRITEATFRVMLLEGVTGSGKTEVYFAAIAKALELGCQVLVMLPEISLSNQWLERFTSRFGFAPEIWHSDISQATKRRVWRLVAEGKSNVVVGARSALWLPFSNLGAIVVDEEHDVGFKQDDGVIYHARDMSVTRAMLENCPIVLCSATPSLETLQNVELGRYQVVKLEDRYGGATLPDIEPVDMRNAMAAKKGWISPAVKDALEVCFSSGEQALLFLNRRGYAPLTLCQACGYRIECPNCSAWLVSHRVRDAFICHHCGYSRPPLDICPKCEAESTLVPCGPGVERVAEEISGMFPNINFEIITSDTVSSSKQVVDLLKRIANKEIDLLIGTQILAKGHDFPFLTFVGVIDADLGLSGGDLRAAERTYQLLEQVAGRAGRSQFKGKVLLQTYMPEHPVMIALCSGNRKLFLREELEARKHTGQPPIGRLAAIILAGRREAVVMNTARLLGQLARKSIAKESRIEIFGPAPAPLSLLRGRYRYRLLVKCARGVLPQPWLREWLAGFDGPSDVTIRVDIDPYSFL